MVAGIKAIAVAVMVVIAPLAHAFEPTIDMKHSISLTPTIYGTTNLPDGAELMLTLARTEVQYVAQKKMTVKNGKFMAAGFSDQGSPLTPGKYAVEIVLVASALNPPNVQAVIGKRGELMTGPLVHQGVIDAKEFTFRSSVDVARLSPPPNLPVESNPYLERAVVQRCKDMVLLQNQAMANGSQPGTPVAGEALRERVRQCIRTAVPAEAAPLVLDRFEKEG